MPLLGPAPFSVARYLVSRTTVPKLALLTARASRTRHDGRRRMGTLPEGESPAATGELSTRELDATLNRRERVVILGSGWAGYSLSRTLDHRKYQVVIVSPRSYFVFTPLLASTAVGTLEFRTAVESIRSRRNRAAFIQGWADDVDLYSKTVRVEEAVADPRQGTALVAARYEGKDAATLDAELVAKHASGQMFNLRYDKLVIAVGCYNQTFDVPGVRQHAHFLKDVGDARKIRRRLLESFETAALPTTPDAVRRQILHFAVVGGGPTGVEFSAELHDLIYQDMARIYPELVQFAKISLFDVSPSVLSAFDARLARYALDLFARGGIDVKTSRTIQSLRAGLPGVDPGLKSGRLGYTLSIAGEPDVGVGMCIWSTGLMMNPFIQKALSTIRRFPPKEVIFKSAMPHAGEIPWHILRDPKTGSIVTNDRLRVLIVPDEAEHAEPGVKAHLRDVFAIGDCSVIEGVQYPATAQVASQKALWLAKRLNRGDLHTTRFRFRNLGILAYLGGSKAIYEIGNKGQGIAGRAAWLVWRGAYLAKSISWRNRVLIPIYWFLNWAFGRDISRF
ncbi:pyridine nucleotide-disulfide oxidoreductase-like protein [Trichodelitschia bisporula]|uniref:Pyridine nucleotide-disulfide oxidoreductase-like protein n=1 Tax=Trichodelitschia bisporula TaxID=703511 RepID=A0A6G1HND2_9PEZI|nr:pyridine nucleotide-disulfide oxidoreductase-like protein [Trichodelitschia bisporula]